MKRVIEVKAGNVKIKAEVNMVGLTRYEIERIVSELADRLMLAAKDLPYDVGGNLSRQKVR
jgi:hypothetical protein